MGSQSRRLAILSFAVSMLAIGLECAGAEECDYKTCGALMVRDGSVSWGVSGRRDYSPDTKRACAELNACVRRAKNNSARRAAAAPAAGSSSLKSSPKGSATVLNPEPCASGLTLKALDLIRPIREADMSGSGLLPCKLTPEPHFAGQKSLPCSRGRGLVTVGRRRISKM